MQRNERLVNGETPEDIKLLGRERGGREKGLATRFISRESTWVLSPGRAGVPMWWAGAARWPKPGQASSQMECLFKGREGSAEPSGDPRWPGSPSCRLTSAWALMTCEKKERLRDLTLGRHICGYHQLCNSAVQLQETVNPSGFVQASSLVHFCSYCTLDLWCFITNANIFHKISFYLYIKRLCLYSVDEKF